MKKIFSIVFSLLMVVQASAADIKMMSYNIKGHDPLAELNQCVLNPAYGFVVNVIDVL